MSRHKLVLLGTIAFVLLGAAVASAAVPLNAGYAGYAGHNHKYFVQARVFGSHGISYFTIGRYGTTACTIRQASGRYWRVLKNGSFRFHTSKGWVSGHFKTSRLAVGVVSSKPCGVPAGTQFHLSYGGA